MRQTFWGVTLGHQLVGARLLAVLAFAAYMGATLLVDKDFWSVGTITALWLPFVVLALVRSSIDVAPDGVLVRSWGKTRFFPAGEIADAQAYTATTRMEDVTRGVELTLRDGRRERIPVASGGPVGGPDQPAKVLAAVQAVMRPGSSELPAEAAALARQEDEPMAWVARLRRMGTEGDLAYRGSAVPRAALEHVVADPAHPAEARAAAAVALAATRDPDVRYRIAAAAAATAEPRLRVALDLASEPHVSDAQLAKALRRLTP